MSHSGYQLAERSQFLRSHELMMQFGVFDSNGKIGGQNFELYHFGYVRTFSEFRAAEEQASDVGTSP